jgi:hypothetical protein
MGRLVEGVDRTQMTLFPECLDDWIDEDNPVRVIDAFVDSIDLGELGFDGVVPEATGRPAYHPSVLLKLYIYGYLNREQSSRRLEREAGRNRADATTTRLMALLRMTASSAAKRNAPIRSGNRNSALPRPTSPPRVPMIAPLKAAAASRVASPSITIPAMSPPRPSLW